ncbi:uncharacterized protein BJX67DRAFT_352022 [Aspergillus lucknowensis]|uniref:Uncharacterized protein n=1 Tax=Aspergillus lucknowensis TaxID=176173 RepID=A0ABR4LSY2_9EURO
MYSVCLTQVNGSKSGHYLSQKIYAEAIFSDHSLVQPNRTALCSLRHNSGKAAAAPAFTTELTALHVQCHIFSLPNGCVPVNMFSDRSFDQTTSYHTTLIEREYAFTLHDGRRGEKQNKNLLMRDACLAQTPRLSKNSLSAVDRPSLASLCQEFF